MSDQVKIQKKRRERGKAASNVNMPKKGYTKKTSKDAAGTSNLASDSASVESDSASLKTDSANLTSDSAPEIDADHCGEPFGEPHLCSDSEGFSETASEFYSSSGADQYHEQPKLVKRYKKSSYLAYQRKRSQKMVGVLKAVNNIDDDESSSSDSDISIPPNLSLSDLDTIDHQAAMSQHDEALDLNVTPTQAGKPCLSASDATESVEMPKQKPTSPHKDSKCSPDHPTSADSNDFCGLLKDNMRSLLSESWSVDVLKENSVLRVFETNASKNVAVNSNIYYATKSGKVGIFLHGVPVSPENRVFKCHTMPDSQSIGSISDFLAELVTRIQIMGTCSGIKAHQEFWDVTRGYLDYSASITAPCFRSSSCDLLIKCNRLICTSCQEEVKKLEREFKRNKKQHADPRTPDKILSQERLEEKKDYFRSMYQSEKQRADRLQRRVDTLQLKLDEALSDELSSILKLNEGKMTELQKIFWEQQIRAMSLNDMRGMRWHPMLIRLALHLHSLSDSAYSFLNESKILILPSKRRLYDYSHFVEPSDGIQPEFIEHITKEINKCAPEEHFSYINLMFDEMHIRSGLVKRSTGELIGYTKLDDVEEELRKMQSEFDMKSYKPKLAKKVLVFMVNGITSNVKNVVATYSTDDLSASHLYERAWDVIYNLEDAGIKVLTVTCDGASVNRKFIFMHESLDKSSKFVFITKNLAAGNARPLFFILDAPHLLKTIRNALASSFAHRYTRKLWKNGEFLSWKVIEVLYEITKDHKFRNHKLTKAHIKLTSFSCMTVLYATQVLSNSVADAIEEFANHDRMKNLETRELVKFIRLMNRFFDCMNGGEKESGEDQEKQGENTASASQGVRDKEEHVLTDKAPFTKSDDPRLKFLKDDLLGYFEDWKIDILNRSGIFSQTEKSRMIISHQGLGSLQVTVNAMVGAIQYMLDVAKAPAVSARKFNQDPLEQYFSKVRRAQGDNRNPSLKNVLDIGLNQHAQGLISSAAMKGNTKAAKRKSIEIDSSPVPSKRGPRK